MKQYLPDVGHLGTCFHFLGTFKTAEYGLTNLASLIEEYDEFIDPFPDVKVQPLEGLYELAHGLGAFETSFLVLQLNSLGWRGIVSGGLYSLMKPSSEHLDFLEGVGDLEYPENLWSTKCAIAYLKSEPWPDECKKFEEPICKIRDAIQRLGIESTPLRRELSETEENEFERFREEMKQCYKERGTDEAREFMKTQQQYQWVVPYDQWRSEFANDSNCVSLYKRGE